MREIAVIQQPVCDAAVIGQLHRQPPVSHLSRRRAAMRALRHYGSIRRFNSLLEYGGFIFGRTLIRQRARRGNGAI
jgi:hypothetical protein